MIYLPPDRTGVPLPEGMTAEQAASLLSDHRKTKFLGITTKAERCSERWDLECCFLSDGETFSLEVFPGAVRVWSGQWEVGESRTRSDESQVLHRRVVEYIQALLESEAHA